MGIFGLRQCGAGLETLSHGHPPKPPATYEKGGAYGPQALERHRGDCSNWSDQRTRRVIANEDSEKHSDGTRLPQHGVIQKRHLVPLWRSVDVP
ncbi:MAG: hypothetical protein OXC80_00105 [Gammaproteobacteria bacterium]|nr:hypothetical protein [Gammaproteobacteria bacterium]